MSADTSPDIAARQVTRWRERSPTERGVLADQRSRDVTQLAIAGIKRQRPEASDADIRRELIHRRYGNLFADAHVNPTHH
ncbi:MAG: hypothetical protein ACOYN3_06525 [Acidimicrobiia bacterium]